MRLKCFLWVVRCLCLAELSWFGDVLAANAVANRLVHLDENDPFYVGLNFPKLTTPQWVGEQDVEAVVILAIDDLREPRRYETWLRPVFERLKEIDGRAPVSVFCNALDPQQPQFQAWLKEGVSLEAHTLNHPCPLLAKGDLAGASRAVLEGLDLLNRIPNNHAAAFRMPCCDSINSPSPRFFAEIFNGVSAAGQFLTIDSSVMNLTTPKDENLPRALVTDADGREKFRKYVPFPSFVTTIEDYPYPYVIGKLCWEFPAMAPSDWEAQHIQGTNNPVTVADWKAALDATVLKRGAFTFIFHPHGWIRPDQIVEFIDYATRTHGKKVKFLTFREAQERLDRNLLDGQSLRAANGQDNGVRLADLNHDGYLDVIIANETRQRTRVWNPNERGWKETGFPTRLTEADATGQRHDRGVKFGVVRSDGGATALVVNESVRSAWHFVQGQWEEDGSLLRGLETDGQPVFTSLQHLDRGVRWRDVDLDGQGELIVGNAEQNAVFGWSAAEKTWKKRPYALPGSAPIVDAAGRDQGVRFIDVNEDGYDDVICSNEERFSLHLFVPKLYLGFQPGWSREVLAGKRGEPGEIPGIVRGGTNRNNGAWFHSRSLWVQNEDTATLKDLVDRRSFDDLLGGLKPAPKSPQAALACIRVRPGFKVELVAHEPLVKDPIALEWGADGKLWVVEMGDYPRGVDGQGRPGGVVRFLEDTDGDGRYDRSTEFLTGVNFPTGVMPWHKGVIVSAAPEIFYAEDTDGDGKADVRQTLFQGFVEGNQQHRVNGFEYGLDNWLYGANGDSGGEIRMAGSLRTRVGGTASERSDRSVMLRGHDFRCQPDEGLFEAVAGQTQYGRHRDDWGNWFGNNNPAWLWHFFIPEHYLARNPHLAVKTLRRYQANYPNSTLAYATSRMVQRFNDIGMAGHVTSANSPTPYRDDLFGPDFAQSVFVSEPVHNLIHREVLEPDGVSFTSHRAPDETDREFLTSTDNWFRPVMMKTGPEGALYIADMYRFVIEHPEWIPADTQKRLDLRVGADLGRIYRVYPTEARLRAIPRLDRLDTPGLVAALDSPNGWQRDTVQRLLVHSGDPSAVPLLENLIGRTPHAKARLQALGALDGLRALTPKILVTALADPHFAVREHAVRLSDPFLADPIHGSVPDRAALENALLGRVEDPSVRVRYQLAFTLGEWKDPRAGSALLRLALKDVEDSDVRTAILSSATPHVATMMEGLFAERTGSPPSRVLEPLLNLATSLADDRAVVTALREITPSVRPAGSWQYAAVGGFLDAVERRVGSLASYQSQASPGVSEAVRQLEGLFTWARLLAVDTQAAEPDRLAAIRLLGRGGSGRSADLETLGRLLSPQTPRGLQRAALGNLGRTKEPRTADVLLSGWRGFGPDLRGEVLSILLSRKDWVMRTLTAIESGAIAPAQVSPSHQQTLLSSSDPLIRQSAQRVFAARSDRKKVLLDYRSALTLAGDSARGAALFRQHCATCHRFRGEGTEIGPDLGALANKAPDALLAAVLDPNQAVETRYISYTAETKSGRELSGVIVAETPNSIALRAPNSPEETVLRTELKELISSGLSLMPEGLETVLKPQDVADLIHFLTHPAGL